MFFIFMSINVFIYEIGFLGLPKNARQGSYVSEGANYFATKMIFLNPEIFAIKPTLVPLLEI